jgi:cell division protease FtsH
MRRDFERAADRVLIGPKREEILTAEDKRRTAYHEAGHALVTWYMPGSERPMKVSIVPRGRALGVNITPPDEDRYHHGADFFKNKLVMALAGRAADRLVYNQAEAGAEDDLRKATRLARLMVTHWGMSDRLGPLYLHIGEEHVFLGKEIQQARDFSEGMAQQVDEEVQRLLREADDAAFRLLETHRRELDRLADELVKREEMSRAEIDELLATPQTAIRAAAQ